MQLDNNKELLEAEVPVEKLCSVIECKESINILEKVSTLLEWRTLIIIFCYYIAASLWKLAGIS